MVRRPQLSIRWRLTLWNVLLLGTALVVLGFAFYYGLQFLTFQSIESTLDNQASVTDDAVVVVGDTLALTSASGTPSDSEQFIRIWNASGNLVVDTSGASIRRRRIQPELSERLRASAPSSGSTPETTMRVSWPNRFVGMGRSSA